MSSDVKDGIRQVIRQREQDGHILRAASEA